MPYFPWFISLVSGLFAFYIHMEVALCHLWCCGSYLFKWLTNLLLLDITNICISLDYFLDLFLFHTYSKPLDHFFSIISALTVILNIFISSLLITYPTSSFWYSIFVCTTFFLNSDLYYGSLTSIWYFLMYPYVWLMCPCSLGNDPNNILLIYPPFHTGMYPLFH